MHAEVAYLFRHALIRSAAYELQLPSDRAALHQLALDVLEQILAGQPSLLEAAAGEMSEHALRARSAPGADQAALAKSRLRYLEMALTVGLREHDLPRVAAFGQELAEEQTLPEQKAAALHHAGIALKNLGRLDRSGACLSDALKMAEQSQVADRISGVLCSICGLLMQLGRSEEADQHMPRLRQLAEVVKGSLQRADIRLTLAQIHRARARVTLALEDGAAALAFFREARVPGRLAMALVEHGNLVIHAGRLQEADALYAEALQTARATGDDWFVGSACTHRAFLERLMGNFKAAAPLYEEAIARLSRCGHLFNLGWAWCDWGGMMHQSGRLLEAEPRYHKAIAVFTEAGVKEGWFCASGNLALCLVERGEYAAAAPLFDAVIAWAEASKLRWRLAEQLSNRAVLESDSGQLEKAILTTETALALCRDGVNPMFEAINTANVARLQGQIGNLEAAEQGLRRAVEMCVDRKWPYFEGAYWAELGHLLLLTGHPEGPESVRQSDAIVRKLGALREWAGRVAPSQIRMAIVAGNLAEAAQIAEEAEEVLRAAGITEAGYSWRSIVEARRCIDAARDGALLHHGFRPQAMHPGLRRALGIMDE